MRRIVIAILLGGLALTGLSAKPAAAADWEQWYGYRCGGIQVDRCAWLDYDRGAGIVRAGGNTRDEPNGGNYSVALSNVTLQILPFGGPWTDIARAGDYDGWHETWDSGYSFNGGVWCGFQYRALTLHRWTGASNGSEWIASDPVMFC